MLLAFSQALRDTHLKRAAKGAGHLRLLGGWTVVGLRWLILQYTFMTRRCYPPSLFYAAFLFLFVVYVWFDGKITSIS